MTKKIGIDIGHGENTFDTGSKGVRKNGIGYEEHHFNATIGLIVDKRLREHGFVTYLAQPAFKNDVPLRTRSNAYNAQDVDLVVSIHANAGVPAGNGMGVFYWKGTAEGLKFSQLFVKNFQDMTDGVGLWGDGIWESYKGSWTNFHIVRETKMTAVLLELGFMTNDNDFKYIFGEHSKKFREDCAEAIVKTVCDLYGVKYKAPSAPVEHDTPAQHNDGNYKIKAGDTFYSIARDFKVSVDAIQKANPKVNPRALTIGSYINIPNGEFVVHKIVKGDTLWGLSQKYKVTLDAIRGANKGIEATELVIGSTVKIPVVKVVAPKPAPKPSPAPSVRFPLPSGVLRRGNTGDAVKKLQTALNALHFNVGAVDGSYGAKTEDAVRRFQMVYDAYHVDGVYGSRTRERMNRLLNK
jgi:N-acetylmuramoyl-L-alanine amidase/LysM repeat protein